MRLIGPDPSHQLQYFPFPIETMTNSSDSSPASLQDPNKLGKGDPSPSLKEADDIGATTGTALVPYAEKPGKPDDSLLDRLLSLIGLRTVGSLREDLEDALAADTSGSDLFTPEERAMLKNILRLREVRVEDVMVPRADIIAVDLQTSLGELLQIFEETGHSRMPVYDGSHDDPRGMVLSKDVAIHLTRKAGAGKRKSRKKTNPRPIDLDFGKIDLSAQLGSLKIIRSVLFVPPSMLASDLMARMQASRTQMALVIDEYGGTDGLVSLEDVVEEVVGEIEDEHDDDDGPMIVADGDGKFTADAKTELDEAVEVIGDNFTFGDLGEDVDTIGGLVFSLAGRIPVRGEVIEGLAGFEFRILDADPRRVKKLQIISTRNRDKRRRSL